METVEREHPQARQAQLCAGLCGLAGWDRVQLLVAEVPLLQRIK